jgi:hypothetical protein
MTTRQGYLSYLLRIWRAGGEGPAWRASLDDVTTGERRAFGSLEGLFAFLRERAAAAEATGPDEDGSAGPAAGEGQQACADETRPGPPGDPPRGAGERG